MKEFMNRYLIFIYPVSSLKKNIKTIEYPWIVYG